MKSEQEKTRDWYKKYYQKKGVDRNDLLTNPEVLFQHLAFEKSVITALRTVIRERKKERMKILDVGCGGGGSLTRFLQLGFIPQNLYGIDIIEERIDEAKGKYPNMNFTCDDAAAMPYESDKFNLVVESTMFVQITDVKLAQQIAGEMLRVTKPLGYILVIDWRYSKPGNSTYLGVSQKRIKEMFSVGKHSKIICQTSGALIPPIGRLISKYLHSLYFLTAVLMPILVGQKSTLIQKTSS